VIPVRLALDSVASASWGRCRRAPSRLAQAGLIALLITPTLDGHAANGAPLEPRVTVSIRDETRPLSPWSSYWILRREGQCADVVSDGIPSYRPRLVAPSRDARPRVMLEKRARPAEIEITTTRKLDADGLRTRPRSHRPRLEPMIEAGEPVGWIARPRIRLQDRAFVSVDVSWFDRSGCFGTDAEEGGSWTFMLRRPRFDQH
jgi:hypothetical protein